MNLPRYLFWDVNYDKIDWDKKSAFVIVRVFERGDIEDIRAVLKYYTDEQVRKSLLETKFIMVHRRYLAAAIIDEPIENFRCYKEQQLNPEHYPY